MVSEGLGAGVTRQLGFAETEVGGVHFGQGGEGGNVMNWLKTWARKLEVHSSPGPTKWVAESWEFFTLFFSVCFRGSI